MKLEQFLNKFAAFGEKDKVIVPCGFESCTRMERLNKNSAIVNIKKNGFFRCRSCSYTEEGKRNIGIANSYKRSPETRKKMAQKKVEFYQTLKGQEMRSRLSISTSQGHSHNKYENSKRNGWYPSAKNGCMVFYGSSYELRFCWMLEQDESVVGYKTQVAFEINGRGRCLDFLVEKADGTFQAVEVKPKDRLGETAFVEQIKDTNDYSIANNLEFQVVTEITLGMTCRELRKWADELRTQLTGIDLVEFQKERDREKSNRHYHAKLKEKIEVFCEYCKTTHEIRSLGYQDNIAKNGRYVCHKENADRPKPSKKKKINPYAAEGKKECVKCKKVKDFIDFGADKSRADGYASRCRDCRKNPEE